MSGYYGDPEATRAALCDAAEGAWLRTGDLGFLREGRLCVTGRAKDILFVSGHNYYAHDLEQVAERVTGVPTGRVAVCGWHDPQSQQEKVLLFLAAGLDSAPALESAGRLFLEVRRALESEAGLTVDVAVPLRAAQLPLAADADGVVRVGNTRVTLQTVIAAFQQGATAEEIAHRYPSLDLADLYAVIGYYLRHGREVDAYLNHQQRQADEVRKQNEARFDPHGVRDRLLARRSGLQP